MADDTKGTVIAEYSPTAAALAELAEKYRGKIYEVENTAGMKLALAARMDLRSRRVELEKTRVAIKEPALRRCQEIDAQAKRITAALSALEDPIDLQIKGEEQKREAARQAKERAEVERLAAIAQAEAEAKRAAEEAALQAQREEIARQRAEVEAERAKAAAERKRLADEQAEADRKAAAIRAEAEAAAFAERERADRAAAAARAEADRVAREEREREWAAQAETQRLADEAEAARVARERDELAAREAAVRAEEARIERVRAAERAQAAAEQAARDEERVRTATLLDAAREALAVLVEIGIGETVVARTLAAAIERSEKPEAAAPLPMPLVMDGGA